MVYCIGSNWWKEKWNYLSNKEITPKYKNSVLFFVCFFLWGVWGCMFTGYVSCCCFFLCKTHPYFLPLFSMPLPTHDSNLIICALWIITKVILSCDILKIIANGSVSSLFWTCVQSQSNIFAKTLKICRGGCLYFVTLAFDISWFIILYFLLVLLFCCAVVVDFVFIYFFNSSTCNYVTSSALVFWYKNKMYRPTRKL